MSAAIMNTAAKTKQYYAGPAFLNSPPSSALPIPEFVQQLVVFGKGTKTSDDTKPVAASLLTEKTDAVSTDIVSIAA